MAQRKREADPPTQIAELERALASKGLERGYVLRGDERYFREQATQRIREKAVAEGLEVCFHDGKDPDFQLGACLEDLTGRSLFAAERLVVIRNAEALLKKSGKEQSPLTRALLAFVEHEELGGAVVLSAATVRTAWP
jgi:DNA polymerase III delta subunit